MPFPNYVGRVFKAAEIQREAPATSGVYGLSNSKGWIFIGETDNIQAQLLLHFYETGSSLSDRLPTGFNFEICAPGGRMARVTRLVFELKPTCQLVTR